MKATRIKDLKGLDEQDLVDKATDLREELGKLRFRAATEDIDNPGRFRAIRREIARIETLLSERRRERAAGAE